MTALSKTAKELKHYEEIIDDGAQAFLHVGRALLAIRDGNLYEENHKSFKAYCKERWNYSISYAYRLIESAEVVKEMSPIGDVHTKESKQNATIVLPSSEFQVRALVTAADDAEDRAKVWEAAVKKAPKNSVGEPVVTAKIVKAVAEELLGPPKGIDAQKSENAPRRAGPVKAADKTNPDPEPSSKPSGGTTFDPSEFDPDIEPEDRDVTDDDPQHLAGVLAGLKQFGSLQREVSLLYGKVEALAKLPIGSYIQLQEIQRQIEQVKASLKAYSFGDNCPTCQNKPKTSCLRCKGRGWLAHSQMGQLSDLDKDWLKTNSVKP